MICKNFVDNVTKFFVLILIFLVLLSQEFSTFGKGEISICKILVPIKEVPRKNDYLLHQKLELYR